MTSNNKKTRTSRKGDSTKAIKRVARSAPSRAKRIFKSTPVWVIVGASAAAFVLAKLKQHFA
jgi:hypothetical protein